jgi:hypothetical protein
MVRVGSTYTAGEWAVPILMARMGNTYHVSESGPVPILIVRVSSTVPILLVRVGNTYTDGESGQCLY